MEWLFALLKPPSGFQIEPAGPIPPSGRVSSRVSPRAIPALCCRSSSSPLSATGGSAMHGLIRASLRNPYAVTVLCLTLVLVGTLAVDQIPVDILPVFKSPAVQVLTFYGGMPAASVEKDITNRMERWTGQASGTSRQESRSIIGASIVRNFSRATSTRTGP